MTKMVLKARTAWAWSTRSAMTARASTVPEAPANPCTARTRISTSIVGLTTAR